MERIEIIEEPKSTMAMNPKKFALWLFIVSIIMVFGALTSAYIVRAAEGNWLQFEIPTMFYVSTAIILLSSGTMHWAYLNARRNELGLLKIAMALTFFLGGLFLYTQWLGWAQLVEMGVFFAGNKANPAGSFFYVISGLHMAHIISGLIYLAIILGACFQFQIHSKSLIRLEMCASYWHFLDVLWIYLFFFLMLNN
jgi:cytochrome c oxidase subunit III